MTMTKRIVRVSIEHDGDCQGPKEWDGQWTLYAFSSKWNTYKDPEELGILRELTDDGKPIVRNLGLRSKLRAGLAFFLSLYEHSGHAWSLMGEGMQCQWDTSSIAGILIWENKPGDMGASREKDPNKRYEGRAKDARSFLDTWNAWENGECYGYSIEADDGSIDESCWGFIGPDLAYMFDEINDHLKDQKDVAIILEGDSKDIAQYHWKDMPETHDDEDDIDDSEKR